jgi:erythrocyte band 7 integral membrane protein
MTGKFVRAVDPGLYRVNPYSEVLYSVDIRMQAEDIPRQYVLTRDNVGIDIDSVLYWHVSDPWACFFVFCARVLLLVG